MIRTSASVLLLPSPPSRAAWIEMPMLCGTCAGKKSPPSRAAWIEIKGLQCGRQARSRRRLHGRRGLKSCYGNYNKQAEMSPPSRAAWIEIPLSAIISAMYRSLHSQVVCMQRFACVICLRSESSLIKNRVTAF